MTQIFYIHPEHPQPRLIRHTAEIIQQGGLVALPTDSSYALVGHLGDKELLDRIRRIRGVDERHLMTLMCADLSQIANYARVDNSVYRQLKATTPGCYTFILEGSRELPRRVLHPKRKTLGLRVPDHVLVQALLAELGEPLLTSTLILPEQADDAQEGEPLNDSHEILDRLEHQIELVVDAGPCSTAQTTVVDLVSGVPVLVRKGCGPLAPLGLAG
ncbi:MAG: threonylcarbamoyl-AMP synthase [Sterolibacterium sp.]|nr:threonylcarbamoyl-AMP synthase [Sterolibacterium sp.]